jgi:protein gp37
MNETKIETFDVSWNPITGCTKGCRYCYINDIINRFGAHQETKETHELTERQKNPYPFGKDFTFHRYRLQEPQRKTKPVNIFVCSMADLFMAPLAWRVEVLRSALRAPQHNYFFLTKAPAFIGSTLVSLGLESGQKITPAMVPNWHFGTTLNSKTDLERLGHLPRLYDHWVSVEPLLGPINPDEAPEFKELEWIVIGAETGKGRKEHEPKQEWIDILINFGQEAGIPVFVKNNVCMTEKVKQFPKKHYELKGVMPI